MCSWLCNLWDVRCGGAAGLVSEICGAGNKSESLCSWGMGLLASMSALIVMMVMSL